MNDNYSLLYCTESDLEKLFFSYPEKKFLRDLEEDEPEIQSRLSGRTKYLGKIALHASIAAAAVLCVYVLAKKLVREIPVSTAVFHHLADNYH